MKKIIIITIVVLAIAGVWYVNYQTPSVEYVSPVIEVTDARDMPQKLTDNLAEAIRSVADSNKTLERAEAALVSAEVLYNEAVNDRNCAIEAINTYEGNVSSDSSCSR